MTERQNHLRQRTVHRGGGGVVPRSPTGRTIPTAVRRLRNVRGKVDPSPRLLRLAEAQHGVLTNRQAASSGFGRHSVTRLVDEGHWQRLGRGLVFAGRHDPPWTALAWGGVLLGGEAARLSRAAAGYLHRILPEPPSLIEVLVPHGVTLQARGPWAFGQERDGVRTYSVGHPPRTSAEDTLLDLCDQRPRGEVIDLVLSAVQQGRVSVGVLTRRLAGRRRFAHRQLLEERVVEAGDGVESVLERRYVHRVERPHGLPARTRQHVDAVGHRRDVRYDEYRTVVELDGRLGHQGMGRFRDMRRDNYAIVSGEAPLRYGLWDVDERPCLVARQVAVVLRCRGWTGELVTCPDCRLVPTTEVHLP